MAGFNKIITAPMSKAISIAVLAGCLLLGVLVGMSPKYTAGSSSGSNGTNLRNPATQEVSLLSEFIGLVLMCCLVILCIVWRR